MRALLSRLGAALVQDDPRNEPSGLDLLEHYGLSRRPLPSSPDGALTWFEAEMGEYEARA